MTPKKAGALIERGNALNPGIDIVVSSLPAVNWMNEWHSSYKLHLTTTFLPLFWFKYQYRYSNKNNTAKTDKRGEKMKFLSQYLIILYISILISGYRNAMSIHCSFGSFSIQVFLLIKHLAWEYDNSGCRKIFYRWKDNICPCYHKIKLEWK